MSIEARWREYLAKPRSTPLEEYDAVAYHALRERAYATVFGREASSVMLETIPTPPFLVGVQVFPPSPAGPAARDFTTLATTGMSNEPMPIPEGAVAGLSRIELLFHVSPEALATTPDLQHFCGDMLFHYAKYPFLEDRFLAPGHFVPVCVLEQGLMRFLGNDAIAGLLLLPPPAELPESELPRHLQLAGDPVGFLAMIPILEDELAFMRTHGLEAFLDEAELPIVYEGPRPSSVKRAPESKPWWKRW